MGSHPSSRNNGRVLAWNGASSIIRAHLVWTLKTSSNNPSLPLPQTETQYSRIGLTLALNKMMRYLTGKNFNARQNSNALSAFFPEISYVGWTRQGGVDIQSEETFLLRLLRLSTIQTHGEGTFFAAGKLLSSTNYHVFCLLRMGSHAMIISPCRRIRKIPLKLYLNISQSWDSSIESSIISK